MNHFPSGTSLNAQLARFKFRGLRETEECFPLLQEIYQQLYWRDHLDHLDLQVKTLEGPPEPPGSTGKYTIGTTWTTWTSR